jgi:predicted nuclease with TOPRIM domain
MLERQDVDMVREERKMLNVRTETWERLQSFGKFRESTDELLNKLMDIAAEHTNTKREHKK